MKEKQEVRKEVDGTGGEGRKGGNVNGGGVKTGALNDSLAEGPKFEVKPLPPAG